MLFSSIPFLYYFLPVVLILYFVFPKTLKNAVLFISSMAFYAWGEPIYAILMLLAVILGYVFGLLIEKFQGKKTAKLLLIIAVSLYLALLAYFKYANFFINNFIALTGLPVNLLNVTLPIGISFYTFQLIGYVIDVYRKDTLAQRSLISFGAYATMFPQLIAGPIVRYADIAAQLNDREHNFSLTSKGIRRFIIGLSKKILIANTLGELCDIFKSSQEVSVIFCWLYAFAFSLHIYYDFSGYSDMAIGLGKIFGFHFCENFNYPYISSCITDFWRRWHISLSSWFRDYVYIPLGGNRVSKPLLFRNILIVWLLTGFWHGADWTFILWGLYFAVLLIAEKFIYGKLLQKTHVFKHFYVIICVMISFVIFNANNVSDAFYCIGGMFGAAGLPFSSPQALYYLRSYSIMLVIAATGSTPFLKNAFTSLEAKRCGSAALTVLEPIFLVILLILCTAYLVDGSYNPFLYFRF